ncbi:hypothetical protein D3C85_1618610 [compost metagenome]
MIVEESIQTIDNQLTNLLELFLSLQFTPVGITQGTKTDQTIRIIEGFQRNGAKMDLTTEVAEADRKHHRVERSVIVDVVDVVYIDSTGSNPLSNEQVTNFCSRDLHLTLDSV